MKYESVRKIFPARLHLEKERKEKITEHLFSLIQALPKEKQVLALNLVNKLFAWPFLVAYNYEDFLSKVIEAVKTRKIQFQVNVSVCEYEPIDQLVIFNYLKFLKELFGKYNINPQFKILITDILEWYNKKEDWREQGEKRLNLYKLLNRNFNTGAEIFLLSSITEEKEYKAAKEKVLSGLIKKYGNKFLLKTPEIFSISPKRFLNLSYSHQYSVVETILVLYLYNLNYTIRMGHKGMKRIDQFIKDFFFKELKKEYTALHIDGGRRLVGDWATPYFTDNPQERILFEDTKEDIKRKYNLASPEYKKWLNKIGIKELNNLIEIINRVKFQKL